MMLYLTTRNSTNTLRYLYRDWARGFRRRMRRATYEDLLARGEVPRATLLFTDHERMDPELLERVRALWDAAVPHCRCLNNPHRVLPRLSLLDRLVERGINTHRAFRLDAVPEDLRFPVFVRGERDHGGPKSDLLADREALEAALARLAPKHPDLLVVEFEDTRGADGLFRKCSVFLIGDAVIPKHVVAGDAWVTKIHRDGLAHAREEETEYYRSNPHDAAVREAFGLAGIEYGRIDYGLKDGRMVVWEINTNPTVMSDWWRMARWRRPMQRDFTARYVAALEALDDTPPGNPIRLNP